MPTGEAGAAQARRSRAQVELPVVLAGIALLLAVNGFGPEPAVTFRVPEGWIDLSPGAPPTGMEDLPEAVRAAALRGKYAAAAVEPAPAGAPLTQTFTAIVSPEVLRGEADAAELEARIVEAMGSQGATVRPDRREAVKVGGVDAFRIELRVSTDAGVNARRIDWMIPAGRQTALLSYTCEESSCPRLAPILDASARATQGARAPGFLARKGVPRGVEHGAVQMLLGLLLVVLVLRARRRAPAAASSTSAR